MITLQKIQSSIEIIVHEVNKKKEKELQKQTKLSTVEMLQILPRCSRLPHRGGIRKGKEEKEENEKNSLFFLPQFPTRHQKQISIKEKKAKRNIVTQIQDVKHHRSKRKSEKKEKQKNLF